MREVFTKTGKGRGQGLGFPTLNLDLPGPLDQPQGVYAGYVTIGAARHPAAFHYGPIPTFNEAELSLEAYLLDVVLSERPESVSFELMEYIRPVRRFSGPEELALQIAQDVREVRRVLEFPVSPRTRIASQ